MLHEPDPLGLALCSLSHVGLMIRIRSSNDMTDQDFYLSVPYLNLLEYLEGYTDRQRQIIASAYGVDGASARDIAQGWLSDTSNFLQVVEGKLGSSQAWRLLEEMAFEHDTPVEIEWMPKRARGKLTDLGLLKPKRGPDKLWEGTLPAAVAVLLAPKLNGTRPSLPILLGQESPERLRELAERHGLEESLPRVETILMLSERFLEAGSVERILELLPDPEWIAAALMIIELGGICYWQEIFGYDLEETPSAERKVVPLMRSQERSEEQNIARALLDLGVIFRTEEEGSEFPLVAVPEELWGGLWELGRGWLMEWTSTAYYNLEEQGARRAGDEEHADLQAMFKWMILEGDRQALFVEKGEPSEELCAHFSQIGGHDDAFWSTVARLGLEMRVLSDHTGQLTYGAEYQALLDLPRGPFVRQALFEWCTGFAAGGADEHLGRSIGLDESWRERMFEILVERHEFVPLWMQFEGVPSQTTGAGVLRAAESGSDELLLMEMGFVVGFVWTLKLVWLDLLSMLESERWYPLTAITELFQMIACLGLFSQLIHLLEHPHLSLYLPVQRASFFTDAFHTAQFRSWTEEVLIHLFIPLGIAALSEDGEMVWLDTRHLRIQSPPGWPDDERVEILKELFGQDELDFRIPNGRAGLRQVAPDVAIVEGKISLDAPIEALRQSLHGHEVKRFDGRHVFVE